MLKIYKLITFSYKINKLSLFTKKILKYLPNRLTPLYSKIYYKKENYLKVKIIVFKYITPPYSKGSVCWYISTLSI